MISDEPVHIATDSQAVIWRLNKIIEHHRRRSYMNLYTKNGIKVLGGSHSSLHRGSTYVRAWDLMKDGQYFTELLIIQKCSEFFYVLLE